MEINSLEGIDNTKAFLSIMDQHPRNHDIFAAGDSDGLFGGKPHCREVPEDLGSQYRKVIMVDRAIMDTADADIVTFVLTRFPFCSSMLEPDLKVLRNYSFRDYFIPDSRVSVPATSFNRVVADNKLSGINWLKLDSQGADSRITRSLESGLLSRLLTVDVEPGLIDAYVSENLFTDVHNYMGKEGFWTSNLNLQVYPRISADKVEEFEKFYRDERIGLDVNRITGSPTASEARYIRTMNQTSDDHSLVLSFVFAILDGQSGFAYEALTEYAEREETRQLSIQCDAHWPSK